MCEEQKFYLNKGVIADPGEYRNWLSDLPDKPAELARIVQNNILHIYWSEAYGVNLTKERAGFVYARFFKNMLIILEKEGWKSLSEKKPADKRFVGTCRDFSLFMTVLCRAKGIPARARCGYATYFNDEKIPFMDHWCCEYWDQEKSKWIRLDPQIDEFQKNELKIDFDVNDMPKGKFLDGAEAWHLFRKEGVVPEHFGIFGYVGQKYLVGNLIRDIASLNKVPLLPWDSWGILKEENLNDDILEYFDSLAGIVLEENWEKIRAAYRDPRIEVKGEIFSYSGDNLEVINLEVS